MRKPTHPAITTKKNVDKFREQIKALGFSYDWEREINTTDPGYFKWTQWIFMQLHKKGLAYLDANTNVAKGMEIAAAITPTDTAAALQIIGVNDTPFA